MAEAITVAGLDAHKVWIKVAPLLAGATKPVEWQLANEKAAVSRPRSRRPRWPTRRRATFVVPARMPRRA